jgi:hypothetical protein
MRYACKILVGESEFLDHVVDVVENGRTMSKLILEKEGVTLGTGLNRFIIWYSDRLLWTR